MVGISLASGAVFAQPQDGEQDHRLRDQLVVHEWGTFTELQDEAGESLNGINTDDEPVPEFVHGFANRVLEKTFGKRYPRGKRLPYRHPGILVRLETPVIYFYPPVNQTGPVTLDVEVQLKGGWLSEFYPKAEYEAPGLEKMRLDSESYGSLRWEGVQVGTEDRYPDTNDPVWLNPRATRAAGLTASNGESEKFLFYRGVGNFSGPVRAKLNRDSGMLELPSRSDEAQEHQLAGSWLVHVAENGEVAFRKLGSKDFSKLKSVQASYRFPEEAFKASNLDLLKTEMHEALVADGLYSDEATAMLNTWNEAYFQSPGLRLFYLVPRQWTDRQMPLTISRPAHTERVMVGRLELISDAQRDLIERIRSTPVTSVDWMNEIPKSEARNKFFQGRSDFGDLGIEIPADFQQYLNLGRFRNSILRAEFAARPNENLGNLLEEYRLNSGFTK
jgi:hypothetical protein